MTRCVVVLILLLLIGEEPWVERHREAVRLLTKAAELSERGEWDRAAQYLPRAATQIRSLSAAESIPAALRDRLTRAARELERLTSHTASTDALLSVRSYLELLADVSRYIDLSFRKTYAEPQLLEQSAGGHASAVSPPARQVTSSEDLRRWGGDASVRFDFEEMPVISEKAYCGGPSKDHILESGGSGVALLDYDNDGRLDIYTVTAQELTAERKLVAHRNALYRNLGNWEFENVSRRARLDAAAWGCGVCAGDYDNDGFLDLYVTNYGPNFLFRNNRDGTFIDVAAEAGVAHTGWSTGCSFLDSDGDGDLDLYVARYVTVSWKNALRAIRTTVWRGGPKVMFGPAGLPGAADLFYRNDGNGRFTNATPSLGLPRQDGYYGFGVLATDYDDDGWIDLYIANDSNPNYLFRNLGIGRFEEVALGSGVALSGDGRAQAGMGVDSGDFDGDGRLDLVVTNFAHDTNTLYRNLDGRLFEDVSQISGLHARTFERLGWGVAFFDAERDGDLDLFFANGHIYPQVDQHPELGETFRQKNQLLVNTGGQFLDLSDAAGAGLQVAKSSRGLAVGDLDNDGDLDLVVSNMDDVPTILQNRTATAGHWLALQFSRPEKNRFCIGARVTITAAGRKQVREIRSGGSYLSQNDLRAYFGLGAFAGAVDVRVRLPGGAEWEWKGLAADRINRLTLRDEERIRK